VTYDLFDAFDYLAIGQLKAQNISAQGARVTAVTRDVSHSRYPGFCDKENGGSLKGNHKIAVGPNYCSLTGNGNE